MKKPEKDKLIWKAQGLAEIKQMVSLLVNKNVILLYYNRDKNKGRRKRNRD